MDIATITTAKYHADLEVKNEAAFDADADARAMFEWILPSSSSWLMRRRISFSDKPVVALIFH